jgi:hypothetical protein
MTNTELHVDFDVKFNRLSSSIYKKTSPEEIDWYLNEAMYEKIQKCLDRKLSKKGEDLEDTKTNVQDIEALFTKKTLPVFKIDSNSGKIILPPDFYHELEASVNVNKACNFVDEVVVNKTVKYFVLPLPSTAMVTWLINATIDAVSVPILVTADIEGTFPVEENYLLIDRVTQVVNTVGTFSIYWENYNGLYHKNSFIFVYEGSGNFTTASSTYNGVVTTPTIKTFVLEQIAFTGGTKLVGSRIIKNEIEERITKNPFKRSDKQSPALLFFNGLLLIKTTNFNINNVVLSYIRKPKRIDYRTNQSIELGSRTGTKYRICQEIVDIAVANCAARSLTPNTQALTNLTT